MSRPARIYRILIVDDNPGDHQLFREAIAELVLPIFIVSCESAITALDLLATDSAFNLVLTDLNMPRMSGLELCAKIAEHPEWGKIPTIIMSSNPKKNLPATMIAQCNAPYFVKPTTWRDFIDLIRDLYVVLRDGTGKGSGRFKTNVAPIAK